MSSARIEELRKKFDENPRRYFAPLANEYRKVGDFDQAIFICQEYLPQQPGHMSGHIVFGQALFEAKRLPEAKTVFETALSLDPENLIALRHLADISRDLGDAPAARSWYDRVLQADPRNEEVIGIMAQLASSQPAAVAAATAPTTEVPASATPSATQPDPATAPTVELSAAAVQEMLKARQGAKDILETTTELTEALNLDTTPTVEISAEPAALEGLEPTSHGGGGDLPFIEPLGLETNAAPGLHAETPAAAPPAALDTISLEIEMPGDPPPAAAVAPTIEIPAVQPPDDGMLDLGSFSIGGEAPAPAAAAPSPVDTPIDGGHEPGELIDLDFATPEPTPAETSPATSVPGMILDAIKSVAPVVQDAVETAAPAMMDFVDTTIPSVVDTLKSAVEAVAETPTVIMEAIRPPATPEPPATTDGPRISQSVPFVTETMAQLYLSQGHRAEAIDIYRKLIDARPEDKDLKARLAAIENESLAMPPVQQSIATPATGATQRFTGTGPSIRKVLRDLFAFDGSASYAMATPQGGGSVPAEIGTIDMLFSSAPISDSLNPLAVAFDGGFVAGQGSIDDLFAGGR